MRKLLISFGNPFFKLLLRSPFHFLASKTVMLMTVTGLKSGRRYTMPVNYVLDNRSVTAVTLKERRWWRNLRGGARVILTMRGKRVTGFAEPVTADDRVHVLEEFYKRVSPVRVLPERLSQMALRRVIILITLE